MSVRNYIGKPEKVNNVDSVLIFFRNAPQSLSQFSQVMFPKIDVSETDKEIKVVADVPGEGWM